MKDYKEKYELGSIVTATRTYNGEIITGEFGGFHLLDKSNPKSIVGVVHTSNRSYDVEPNSIESVISEDEKIRKEILNVFKQLDKGTTICGKNYDYAKFIVWLEKQGMSAKLSEEEQNKIAKGVLTSCAMSFIDYLDAHKYEGKMCVSNGECEDIENAFHNAMWDRLHRYYCKYIENQCEQMPANKIDPKFKVGDWVVTSYGKVNQVVAVDKDGDGFTLDDDTYFSGSWKNDYHLWTIQDAKEGDVLEFGDHGRLVIGIVSFVNEITGKVDVSCLLEDNKLKIGNFYALDTINPHPATTEQRVLLFSKIGESGYTWDAKKKELKKIEPIQPELPNGEDYGIDSLYHAARILEKTLGDVDGYQSDDGILEHKCAIELVNRLYKQKTTLSEEDEKMLDSAIYLSENSRCDMCKEETVSWLKSLKERMKGEMTR